MVLMMLPSALLEVPVELVLFALEPASRFAIELSMNDEMIDCVDAALVADVVVEVLELLPVKELRRF
jgi:hypothetical protein